MIHTTTTVELVADHFRRVCAAAAGFSLVGFRWALPWFCYLLSPLLNRIGPRHIRFGSFHVRGGKADLYTFANLFQDYPVALIRNALRHVDLVLDLGANVGAFSWLVTTLCGQEKLRRRIIALEPNAANAAFLLEQPFAADVEVEESAVGPVGGKGHLIAGQNSVTDHIDFSENKNGREVPVHSFDSLCSRPVLVKMDIEGSEWPILRRGLPESVRHLFVEWHPSPDADETGAMPPDFVFGNWKMLSRDPYGSTMWYFWR
jgi:FkbM family methyltransferase